MQRKPFNLEAALAGAPVVTRDGRPVKIAGYNPEATPGNEVLCWINGNCWAHHPNGLFVESKEGSQDLFMAPIERTEYVVRSKMGVLYGSYSKEGAEKKADEVDGTIHPITIIE